MHVLLAPDSFKECLTATEVAEAMARGVVAAVPGATVDRCPAADGGEGTCDALVAATGGSTRPQPVTGPLGEPVDAAVGLLGDGTTAVVEMASAAGLDLVPPHSRDPRRTTTYGVGELANHALDAGATALLITLGGSATTDGAAGMLQAMGLVCFDAQGQRITGPLTGGQLRRVARIDAGPLQRRLGGCAVRVACDVTNPLTGPNGAAHVYGPQKGADAATVAELDDALRHWAGLIHEATGNDVEALPGAGAAGGMGAGLAGLLGAELLPGAGLVLDAVGFDARVKPATLCLTGEGQIDGQSRSGKLVLAIAGRAQATGVPTVALVGAMGPDAELCCKPHTPGGLDAIEVISAGTGYSTERSMREAGLLVERVAAAVAQRHA